MSTFEEELKSRKAQEKLDAEEYLVIAQTVAVLLGGVVKPKPMSDDHWCNTRPCVSFDNDSSIDLVFNEYNNKGKIRVYGNMPKDSSNRMIGKSAGGINISTSKTPQQIAKDIQRRFMPEYTECWTKAVQQKQESDDYQAKKEERKGLLCKINGVTRSTYNDTLHVSCNGMSGSITYIGTDGTCSVELRNVNTALLKNLLS